MYTTSASKTGSFYNPKSTFHSSKIAPQQMDPPGHKWTNTKFSTGVHASQEQFLGPHTSDPVVRWGQTMIPGSGTTQWQTQSIALFPKTE